MEHFYRFMFGALSTDQSCTETAGEPTSRERRSRNSLPNAMTGRHIAAARSAYAGARPGASGNRLERAGCAALMRVAAGFVFELLQCFPHRGDVVRHRGGRVKS